jgi:hypothetical protein
MSKFKSIRTKLNAVLLFSVAAVLTACGSNDYVVNTSFDTTQDIKEGAAIYMNSEIVGEVLDVEMSGSGSVLELKIDKEFAKEIGAASAIVVNRLKEGAPLEIVNREARDQSMLVEGQSIKGLDSMLQLGAWMVGDAIQLGTGTASQMVESFQEYLSSEKFDNDKDAVREQIDSAKLAAERTLKNVEQELEKAAQDLSHAEIEAAKAMEQLGEELAPLIEKLASEGSTLSQQLEEFTLNLENVDPDDQLAGEQFLASLEAMLERLNQSVEEGSRAAEGETQDDQQN